VELNIELLSKYWSEYLQTLDKDEDSRYTSDYADAFDHMVYFIEWYYATKSPGVTEARAKNNRKTIAVDFDGVLHSYCRSIALDEQHLVYDPPVEGSLEWVNMVLEEFDIVVYTARHVSPGGLEATVAWLKEWGFPELPVTGVKPVARLYIDDRGYSFTGDNFPTMEYLRTFQPWNREEGRWNRE
jgi:hypothetical protein